MKNQNIVKTFIFILISFIFCFQNFTAAQGTEVISGKFRASGGVKILKTFAASKGDVINIKILSLHKILGVDIYLTQIPGDATVLELQDATDVTKQIVAPTNVIYQVYYAGEHVDFEIKITKTSTKPIAPSIVEAN